jgi:uncharacterized phage-associated protein
MEESYVTFDREKFKQVVHYVCAACEPAKLGNVKLHKILYFADMLYFLAHQKPLTGVDYLKQKFGPTARHLSATIAELERDGEMKVVKRDYYGFVKIDYVSLRIPQHRLSNIEIALIKEVINFVVEMSATEISELSHNAAWDAVSLGERIPYASVYGLIPVDVTEEEKQAAQSWAAQMRPVIEADRHARVG